MNQGKWIFSFLLLTIIFFFSNCRERDDEEILEYRVDVNEPASVLITPDGKILVAGYHRGEDSTETILVSYNENGSLNMDFGNMGKLQMETVGVPNIVIALQGSDRLLMLSAFYPYNTTDYAILDRFYLDGSRDNSFGDNGTYYYDNSYNKTLSVFEDKSILFGSSAKIGKSKYGEQFLVVKCTPEGKPDSTFNLGQGLNIDFGLDRNDLKCIDVQGSGEILVGGRTSNTGESNFAVARISPNGSIDTSFGDEGKVVTDIGRVDGARDILVQPDGKVLVVGSVIIRYNVDGSLDQEFGVNGVGQLDIEGSGFYPVNLCLQSDGKVIVVGYSNIKGATTLANDFTILRLNPNGSLDVSYGNNGVIKTDVNNGENRSISAILQEDEKLIVIGKYEYNNGVDNFSDFVILRYNIDGSLDASFGDGGVVISGF